MALGYKYHPTLRDVFVEGPRDRQLVRLVLSRCAVHASVSEVDTVHLDVPLLAKFGLTEGARSRVQALAGELAGRNGSEVSRQVVCVVDRDYDDALGVAPLPYAPLLSADGSTLEAVTWHLSTLEQFCGLFLGGFPLEPREILEEIRPILRVRFAQAAAATRLQLNLARVSLKRYVRASSAGALQFDAEGYLQAWLNGSSELARLDEMRAQVRDLVPVVEALPYDAFNSEDFFEVMYLLVKRRKNVGVGDVEKGLLTSIDAHEIADLPLFREISRRLGSS